MRRILVLACLVAMLLPPSGALADEAEDRAACFDDNTPSSLRLAACEGLLALPDLTASDKVLALRSSGDARQDLDDPFGAITAYNEAIAIDPNDAPSFTGRGEANLAIDRFGDARHDFETAIALDPDDYWNYNRLGLTLRLSGDLEGALAPFATALELNPRSASTLVERGNLLRQMGRFEEAVTDFDAAAEIISLNQFIFQGRGLAYLGLGDEAAAIADLRVSFLIAPNFASVRSQLGELVPPREPPEDQPPLSFMSPESALRVVYVSVTLDEERELEPIESAIMGIVEVITGSRLPEPLSRSIIRLDIGEVEDATVAIEASNHVGNRLNNDEESGTYLGGIFPLRRVVSGGPEAVFEYDDAAEAIWGLSPGQSISGIATENLVCSAALGPLGPALGCDDETPMVPTRSIEWTITFEGWEYVLVPAGQRLAARIAYSETVTTEMLGLTRINNNETTWWFDPTIGWWIKRIRVLREPGEELGTVTNLEAVTIAPRG